MTELKFQLRLTLNDAFAQTARADPGSPSIAPLTEILKQHDAALKCQFDAFADYVRQAEADGTENYPLYDWTKKTIEDPAKEQKYTRSFTLYVGGEEVYQNDKADHAETDSSAVTTAAKLLTDTLATDANTFADTVAPAP